MGYEGCTPCTPVGYAGCTPCTPVGPGRLAPGTPVGPGRLAPVTPVGYGGYARYTPVGYGGYARYTPLGYTPGYTPPFLLHPGYTHHPTSVRCTADHAGLLTSVGGEGALGSERRKPVGERHS